MNAPKQQINRSPWEDASLENLFRNELSYARDPISVHGYQSRPEFKWIYKNKVEELLYRGLTKFAPLYPIGAYKNKVSAWVSPPPSGYNNSVLIILGKDTAGKKRLIGTNYANWPRGGSGLVKSDFFNEYDQLTTSTDKVNLIFSTVSSHMNSNDVGIAKDVAYQSEFFRTMPIALLVLDKNKSHIAFSPAVVYGNYPADFTKEFMGEIL